MPHSLNGGEKASVSDEASIAWLRAGVELKNVKMSMNPFCENAMEEAVKLKVRSKTEKKE